MRDVRNPGPGMEQRRPVYLEPPPALIGERKDLEPVFDKQFGIRLGGRSYYINLRIGSELRTPRRVEAEGQVPVSGVALVYCVLVSAAIMLFGMLCMLYLLKSGMGIDLWDADSPLHPLFEMFAGKGS